MDFPDPKPTPEEMVETYVQTCAKVLGSVEEAKKRIYACSTTTYTGFQVEISEEMSEKFRGLPGVVFILPDSYLYPETKEYGGDKYDNGVITPRPPPIQYGTQNRRRNPARFDRDRPYNNPGAQQQQGNFQNYPRQPPGNFQSSPQQQGQRPWNPPSYPHQQGQQPGNFQNYPNQRGRPGNFQNYPNQQGKPGDFQNYPQQQSNFQNYSQQPGSFQNYPQGPRQNYGPPQGVRDGDYQREFNQGQIGSFGPREQRNFSQGRPPGYGVGPAGDAHGGPTQGHHQSWKERQ